MTTDLKKLAPGTAALVQRHQCETAALPMNPPRDTVLLHAQRQALELLEHAHTLELECAALQSKISEATQQLLNEPDKSDRVLVILTDCLLARHEEAAPQVVDPSGFSMGDPHPCDVSRAQPAPQDGETKV